MLDVAAHDCECTAGRGVSVRASKVIRDDNATHPRSCRHARVFSAETTSGAVIFVPAMSRHAGECGHVHLPMVVVVWS